jgi:glycosyltransferase involved in cell wall biosynthesis
MFYQVETNPKTMALSTEFQRGIYLKNQEPLVSVIIPTYNRPAYLKKAIESAARQTYQNIEIIVSDNCTPENPQAIIESFQDSRIQFWRNETNIGMLANAMNAFKKARGKYVACLHDDDMWNEEFLEKLVPHLESNPDLALAFCDHYVMNSADAIDYPATEKCTQFYKRSQLKEGVYQPFCELGLVHGVVPSVVAAVIRKDVVDWDDIPPQVGSLYDLYITYLCCRSGRGAYYCPERLTRYREHAQTDTMLSGRRDIQAKIRKAKAEIFCYQRFMEDKQLKEFNSYFKQKWVHANTTLGIGLMRAKQVAEARPYFLLVLGQKFDLRTIAALVLSFIPQRLARGFQVARNQKLFLKLSNHLLQRDVVEKKQQMPEIAF